MNDSIRRLSQADKSAWLNLYHSYLEFYETEPEELATELLWNRIIKEDPEIHALLVELDGMVVGIVHFHYQLSTWAQTWHCYLEDLYVSEDARGKGAARALIEEVKRLAIERKCSELFWITKESNQIARTLYDKVATQSDFVRYEIKLEID
jgi:ribosomal protein S18 acetylase RimI-like enzyme